MLTEIKRDYVADMRENLVEYISKTKESQSRIAKELGVSKAGLSLFLSNTYTGNNQALAEKIEQFIQMGAARQTVAKAPPFCQNVSNTRTVLEMTRIAHLYGDIVLIYGSAGCSKSSSLQHYAKCYNGVIYAEADVTTNSPRCILKLILSAMDEDEKGSTTDLMRRIISKLADTNMLLIIDEAQHLTEKAFDAIRAINDKTHCGIVYAGNPSILKRMFGRQEEEYEQLYSRAVYRCPLKHSYTQEDISEMYSGYAFSKECLKYLHMVSRRKGGLRLMTNQCRIAQNLATALQEEFSIEHLEKAAVRMGIGGAI